MLRGYRRYIAAAFGLVALSILLAVGFQQIDAERYQPPAEHPRQALDKRSLDSGRIADVLESIRDDQQSADNSERESRNLDAQEGAARWTKWSAWASVLQVIVSSLGLAALIWTLRQTELSLKAGREANTITEKIGKAQVRAYLSVGVSTQSYDPGKGLTVDFTVTNSGQSPARKLQLRLRPHVMTKGLPNPLGETLDPIGDLSSSVVPIISSILVSQTVLNGRFDDKMSYLGFEVEAEYWDVFNERQTDLFMFDGLGVKDLFSIKIRARRYGMMSFHTH